MFSWRGWGGVFPPSVLNQSFSNLHIMPPRSHLHRFLAGLSVYNSAQRYWLQIMINNNYIDKNGTLAITSDLICRPLCTLWCIQYHNHAWVHLVWKDGGWKKINVIALISKEKKNHTCRYCVDSALQSKHRAAVLLGLMLKRPLIHGLTYSPASVQQQAPRRKATPPPSTAAIVSLH